MYLTVKYRRHLVFSSQALHIHKLDWLERGGVDALQKSLNVEIIP